MVAPKENLLSLDHQINMERRTFKTQRISPQKQKTLHLQQHCQEMQDGVMRAQHHNRQLLQHFEEAQSTLREMATLTAAMRTTRMEYEQHLMGIPQWRHQLQENTQEKRHLHNPGDRTSSSSDPPLPSQPSGDGSFHSLHIQPSWMMHPRNLQDSSHVPQLSSTPLQLLHRASALNHHQMLPCHNEPEQPGFWPADVARIPSGSGARSCKTEPPAESWQHSQTSSLPSSYRKSVGSRNSRSAQELDTQPVRLSCSAESSDSTAESHQLSRKKRGKPKHSSDRDHGSLDFQADSVVRTGEKTAQSSGSIASSEESRSSTKGAGPDCAPLQVKNGVQERKSRKKEDSQSSSEESRPDQTGREEAGAMRGNSGSVSLKIKTEYLSNRSEGESEEVKDGERLQEEEPEESDEEVESDENDVRDEEEQERKEEHVSRRNKTADEEEEEALAEEEMEEQESEGSDGMKDEDVRKLDSASSQDENKSEASEDLSEEEEESDEDKSQCSSNDEEVEMEEVAQEKKGDEAAQTEDESDSDDCIISTQKCKMLHIIPEEAPEEDEEEEDDDEEEEEEEEEAAAQPGISEEGSDEPSEDDIEDLRAPPQSPKTQEKEPKPEQNPKGSYDRTEIFQVETEEGSAHGDHPTDSDEFDHFFD